MNSPKPNIVLVPGAWVFASSFAGLQDELTALDYHTEVVQLPSAGSSPPVKGPDDDTAALRSILSRNVEQGNEVVVVAHSYGGVVAGNSVEEFTLAHRRARGKKGGVILLIYMAAFALPKGKSLYDMLNGVMPPFCIMEGDVVKVDVEQTSKIAFNDFSPADAAEFAAQLTHTSSSCFRSTATYEPWTDVPCMYIFTTSDLSIPYPVQQQMASQLGDATNFDIKAGHCPHISSTQEVVEGIQLGIRNVKG